MSQREIQTGYAGYAGEGKETITRCFISIKLELFSQRKSVGMKLKFPWMNYDAKNMN